MPTFAIHLDSTDAGHGVADQPLVALDEAHARDLLARRGLAGTVTRVDSKHGLDVVRRGADLRELIRENRRRGKLSGLAPTMGALHEGHISLVKASRSRCDFTAATIFVNPTQFGPNEDFQKYPRTLDRDLQLLSESGADACFVPEVEEMYPPGCTTTVAPPKVARRWEGECRPGHFEGVATIVLKLLNIAPVDEAFFGRKDYQQAKVIEQMVADLSVGTSIRTCPIIREPSGLALSSRNRYLSPAERQTALAVPACLARAEQLFEAGERDPDVIGDAMRQTLAGQGVSRVDYAVVVDAETLEPLEKLDRAAVALVAAFVGSTRLIDNRELPTAL